MRVAPIPDHAVWAGAERVTIGPPPDDTTGKIVPVEAVQWSSGELGVLVRSVRCVLEEGELATLARGGHVWLSFYGAVIVPFALDVAGDTDPAAAVEPDPADAPSKRLGLIEAVLRGAVYSIDDYPDPETNTPMRVITADDVPHILAEIARRWNAPAFRDAGEEDAGGG